MRGARGLSRGSGVRGTSCRAGDDRRHARTWRPTSVARLVARFASPDAFIGASHFYVPEYLAAPETDARSTRAAQAGLPTLSGRSGSEGAVKCAPSQVDN